MWLKLRKRHFREIAIYMTVASTGGICQCWGSGNSLFSGGKVNPWWRKAYTQFQWIELLFSNSSFLFIPVEYNKSTQKRIYVKTSRNNNTKYHKWLFQTAEKRSEMAGEEGFPLHNEGMMLVNVIWLGREIYTGSQKSGSVTTG